MDFPHIERNMSGWWAQPFFCAGKIVLPLMFHGHNANAFVLFMYKRHYGVTWFRNKWMHLVEQGASHTSESLFSWALDQRESGHQGIHLCNRRLLVTVLTIWDIPLTGKEQHKNNKKCHYCVFPSWMPLVYCWLSITFKSDISDYLFPDAWV